MLNRAHSRRRLLLSLVGGLAAAILAFLVLPGAAHADPSFTKLCFSGNLVPAMASGDFNNDGKLDIAINPGSSSFPFFAITSLIHVYFGNGDGTFAGPVETDIGVAYLNLEAGDVNNDGKLDLVTGNVRVLLGNGDGTFQAPQATPGSGSDIALGDLNQDGYLDIATTDGGSPGKRVAVLLNRGNGTFQDPVYYRTGDYNRAIVMTDLNADGLLDVATADDFQNNGVTVLLGKGDGRFRDPIKTKLPGFTGRDLAAADFNADGKQDLAVPVQGGLGVVTILGNEDGTFGPPQTYPMAGNTLHLAVGDLNGDGAPDIVAGNYLANYPSTGGNATILYGNGAGSFTAAAPIPVDFGHGVLIADFNADGRKDFVVDACLFRNDGPPMAAGSARLTPQPKPSLDGLATVSPNPLRDHGRLSFSLTKEGRVSVHLYDLRGRRVGTLVDGAWLSAGSHSFEVDRSGLKAGMFFYRVESEGGRSSGRIIVVDR